MNSELKEPTIDAWDEWLERFEDDLAPKPKVAVHSGVNKSEQAGVWGESLSIKLLRIWLKSQGLRGGKL
jgi:hypothetical protein